MERLYDLHCPNMKYERHLPIFLDPGNANQYIPMTLGVVQEWAKALVSPASSTQCQSLMLMTFESVELQGQWGFSLLTPLLHQVCQSQLEETQGQSFIWLQQCHQYFGPLTQKQEWRQQPDTLGQQLLFICPIRIWNNGRLS